MLLSDLPGASSPGADHACTIVPADTIRSAALAERKPERPGPGEQNCHLRGMVVRPRPSVEPGLAPRVICGVSGKHRSPILELPGERCLCPRERTARRIQNTERLL